MDESYSQASRGPMPPVLLFVGILLMVALPLLVPMVQLLLFPWPFFGVALVLAGLVRLVWADQLFKRASTTVNPLEPSISPVLKGPFLFTGNPMYLGMVLVLACIAIGLASSTPWLVVPLFVWLVTQRFIVLEEHKPESAFCRQYPEYKATVRCWS